MKLISKFKLAIILLFSIIISNAQIKNTKSEMIKIYGNCDMCKTTIEKAGSLKNISNVVWNVDTKIATVVYDEKKSSANEILKRIALAGYDSNEFLAPNEDYSKLPKCCQYERGAKISSKIEKLKTNIDINEIKADTRKGEIQNENELKKVYEIYFELKDALVKTDGDNAAIMGKDLVLAIKTVKMENLNKTEHETWMKVFQNLTINATSISQTKDIEKQRSFFNALSKGIYEQIKVSKPKQTFYYQYCPMKKMNWLSKEITIKNPYYGSTMLSCGKVIETIK